MMELKSVVAKRTDHEGEMKEVENGIPWLLHEGDDKIEGGSFHNDKTCPWDSSTRRIALEKIDDFEGWILARHEKYWENWFCWVIGGSELDDGKKEEISVSLLIKNLWQWSEWVPLERERQWKKKELKGVEEKKSSN